MRQVDRVAKDAQEMVVRILAVLTVPQKGGIWKADVIRQAQDHKDDVVGGQVKLIDTEEMTLEGFGADGGN